MKCVGFCDKILKLIKFIRENPEDGSTCCMNPSDRKGERSRVCHDSLRRFRDVFLALVMLVLLWPLMLAAAVLIVLESPGAGPVFAQTRVGLNGKEFTFYKFRTMHPGAESELESLLHQNEMQGPVFKMRDDPRVTKVGRLLRRSSIDELPQLWNVLKGDMSIVGPRPALPREVAQYDEYSRQRLSVIPGMTCYWQVQPDRNSLSFREWLELDLKYIREQSHTVDLKIIARTAVAVLGMNGI